MLLDKCDHFCGGHLSSPYGIAKRHANVVACILELPVALDVRWDCEEDRCHIPASTNLSVNHINGIHQAVNCSLDHGALTRQYEVVEELLELLETIILTFHIYINDPCCGQTCGHKDVNGISFVSFRDPLAQNELLEASLQYGVCMSFVIRKS